MINHSSLRRGVTHNKTLIAILIVLAIVIAILIMLGIFILLAGVAIVAVVPQQPGARIDTTKIRLKQIECALEVYNVNIGHYPNEQEGGLEALRVKPSFDNEAMGQNWRGPYIMEEPTDSWGNKFNYQLSQPGTPEVEQTPYRLWSNGPDGMDGTDDDIKNWSDAWK